MPLPVCLLPCLAALAVAAQQPAAAPEPVRVVVVTGGHDFEREPFAAMFDGLEGVAWREVVQPTANETLYTPEGAATYDVLVWYDLNQAITDEQKAALMAVLQRGKGLVVLHHALADYQDWPEAMQIIGGRYYLAPVTRDGTAIPASTYREGVQVPVRVADPTHPVTAGLTEFVLHDEVYGGYEVLPRVHPLLTTDHPESSPVLAWAHVWGNSRIVAIQPGHGRGSYEDPSYRRLLQQAIRWVAEAP